MFFFVYSALNILLTPLVWCLLRYRVFKGKEHKSRLSERVGKPSAARPYGKIIWIHAASVGEFLSAVPTIKYLATKTDHHVLVTTSTLTASEVFCKTSGLDGVIHQFVPVDNYFAVRRFLSFWKPSLAIFVDSEFWPLMVFTAARYCNLISFNTVLSKASLAKWEFAKPLLCEMLAKFSLFMPQSNKNMQRLLSLKIPSNKICYLGHLKYSVPVEQVKNEEYKEMQSMLQERDVVLLASTHKGEEEVMLEALSQIKSTKPLLLIIAPRHPHRREALIELFNAHTIAVSVRSKGEKITDKTQVYLADTIGEMPLFFKLAKITILGGTLVPGIGGHNPIEAAKSDSVLVIGPYDHVFEEIYNEFYTKNAAIRILNAKECAKAVSLLLTDDKTYKAYKQNASKLVDSKKRILEQSKNYIDKFFT